MAQTKKTRLEDFIEEVFNQGRIEATDGYMDSAIVEHAPWPGHPATRAGFKSGLAEMRTGFPDLAVSVEQVITQNDLVVGHFRMSGTHLGDFMGAPASGKTFNIEAIDIVRMKDGLIAEHWGVIDTAAMTEQLGLVS